MFVDKAQVKVIAGRGGDGHLSFRREKFVDKGGPDGGDGGHGGNVIFVASNNQNTLAKFRFQKELKAASGQPGGKRRQHGKNGKDLIVALPVGTAISDSQNQLVADLVSDGQEVIIANGGKGGFGNAHFVSSTRQAPRMAEKGEPGQEFDLSLELKMIADVGLIGLPNAGKSTLLGAISNARPTIANYPFTTLIPNLGMVKTGEQELLFADIPGLIAGASQGKGLGDEFLRHIERTKVLVHLIDAYQDDLAVAYQTVQDELKKYKLNLSKRPQLIVLTKIDGLDEVLVKDRLRELKIALPARSKPMAISAVSGQNLPLLLKAIQELVSNSERVYKKKQKPAKPVIRLSDDSGWRVIRDGKLFKVTGVKIEQFAARTDFSNSFATERLWDIMKKMGIMHELARQNVKSGDKIQIGNDRTQHLEYS